MKWISKLNEKIIRKHIGEGLLHWKNLASWQVAVKFDIKRLNLILNMILVDHQV